MSTTSNTTADTTAKDAGGVVAMKPCPWCGRPVSPLVEEGATFRWRRVTGCCADGPEVRHNTLTDDQDAAKAESTAAAIEAWNSRPVEDTLRAQLEAAEAEKREAWAAVESKAGWEWKKRAEAAEAEVARLRGLLQQTAAVGITMLFDSHADDVRGEFSVGELMEVVAVSEPLNAQDAKVEKVYRTAWDAARTKEAAP